MIQEQLRSATIFQFPVGGRDGLNAPRAGQPGHEDALPRGVDYGAGESWYHAEAIRDARQAKPQ